MRRLPLVFVLLVLVVAASACEDNTTPTQPTASILTATVTPNPITVTAGSYAGFQYLATFTLAVTESAGLGANINLINCTLRDSTTGVEVRTISFDANFIRYRSGSPYVYPNSTRTVSLDVEYNLGSGSRVAEMTLVVQLVDDHGHKVNLTVTARIIAV